MVVIAPYTRLAIPLANSCYPSSKNGVIMVLCYGASISIFKGASGVAKFRQHLAPTLDGKVSKTGLKSSFARGVSTADTLDFTGFVVT